MEVFVEVVGVVELAARDVVGHFVQVVDHALKDIDAIGFNHFGRCFRVSGAKLVKNPIIFRRGLFCVEKTESS